MAERHGMTHTRVYEIWCGIKKRCLNPNSSRYEWYGGRGITICDRWRDSFVAFYNDMGDCPDGYSIEREDVNGNYEPGNCKWLPLAEQAKNRRPAPHRPRSASKCLEYELEYETGEIIRVRGLNEWCRQRGINRGNLSMVGHRHKNVSGIIRCERVDRLDK